MPTVNFPLFVPHYDYVRVVSWDVNHYHEWLNALLLGTDLSTDRVSRFQQYVGFCGDHSFIGDGVQTTKEGETRRHFLAHVSGYDAERFKAVFDGIGGDYTRVDYCVTIPMPKGWNADRTVVELRHKGIKYGTSVGMRSDDKAKGLTMYMGKRDQKKYYFRMYEKSVHSGLNRESLSCVRWELEAGKKVTPLGVDRATLLRRMVDRLLGTPDLCDEIDEEWASAWKIAKNEFLYLMENGSKGSKVAMVGHKGNTWEWMVGVVKSSMLKYAAKSEKNAHDIKNLCNHIITSIDRMDNGR